MFLIDVLAKNRQEKTYPSIPLPQCFSCLQLSLSKASAKIRSFFYLAKIILFSIGNAHSLRRRRLAHDERASQMQQGVGRKALNSRLRGGDWAAKVPADEGMKRDIDIIRELLKLYSLLHRKVIVRSN